VGSCGPVLHTVPSASRFRLSAVASRPSGRVIMSAAVTRAAMKMDWRTGYRLAKSGGLASYGPDLRALSRGAQTTSIES